MFVGRNGGGVLGLFRSRGKKGRKTKKKKETDLLGSSFGGGWEHRSP